MALSAVADVADQLVERVNGGVHKIFLQEREVELEVRQLTATAQRFGQQHAEWTAAFHAFDDALKVLVGPEALTNCLSWASLRGPWSNKFSADSLHC